MRRGTEAIHLCRPSERKMEQASQGIGMSGSKFSVGHYFFLVKDSFGDALGQSHKTRH